jgi:hypothetical protein
MNTPKEMHLVENKFRGTREERSNSSLAKTPSNEVHSFLLFRSSSNWCPENDSFIKINRAMAGDAFKRLLKGVTPKDRWEVKRFMMIRDKKPGIIKRTLGKKHRLNPKTGSRRGRSSALKKA